MFQKLKQHLEQNFPFLKDQKLLLTVSGGIDSLVMTYLFHALDYSIGIAHCNFQLRGHESDLDELFVKNIATNMNCSFHSIRFDTKNYCQQHKVSTQIAARELRYSWFDKLCKTEHYDTILTAHHLNDVIETFFINLSRGTGIDGLTGIPAINGNIVRPLLIFSRNEIDAYATSHHIKWREDKSNAKTDYLRNKIRHLVIPELHNLNPNFKENFTQTIVHLKQSRDFIDQKINNLKQDLFTEQKGILSISKTALLQLSDFELYEVFKPYGFTSVAELRKLAKTQTGKEIHSDTYHLLNNREVLMLYSSENKQQEFFYIQDLNDTSHLPISLHFSTKTKELNRDTIALDPEKTQFPLILRKREDGDFFHPTGMQGKKKVSKYFKDEKLSKIEKENTWLLCNSKNQILWIVNYRSDRYLTEVIPKENTIFVSKQ
ncbi:tRNA lysidine(34) synthetase TilS [Wenyingzhuangia sp. 2_MG-2023]|uniref:tRNA lysidine(34) synthetase TilS n=1 Tax=Wenyingzhuangia sp. 2_MG-2023 TaxID=3062639 RepID=UPI0026E16EFB|nr:tRNA lysidine(34) synthetase TilS [Wenyingzhuangia sp. 2_MG-2023]MDO6737618.1 tRNA lysidine(34) synthetase TilS [Wenyingzhuangia sp. 2_MG-2023]